jgi:hypothetical protein
MTLKGYWVRDLLRVWHKAALDKPDEHDRYTVRCLPSAIDVDIAGIPGAGAQFCDDCMDAVERDERVG